MKTLRPYQQSAIDSLFDWLQTKSGNPLIVAPVGAGKSLIIAEIIKAIHALDPRCRIVVLTHVKELLQQNAEELMEQYPTVDMGFYCASLNQKRLYNDVTFASIQSVHNKIARFNRCPEVILIDEAHLISHNDQTQYRRFIDAVLAINPNAKIIGLTGTPFRADSGRLDEGEGRLFDGVCYEIDIGWMVREGYLCRPVVPSISNEMNVDGVKTAKGDYVAKQLEAAVDVDEVTKACVKELVEKAASRKKWLVFTAGVQHCEHVVAEIKTYGIDCRMVTGETPQTEREATIAWFAEESEAVKCLVNVAVLTTGFNVPAIDCLAFMRPTKSPVLYIQCIGRGIRTVYADGYDLSTASGRLEAIAASDKPDCLVLDFGRVVATLGAIDSIDIRKSPRAKADENKEKGEAITKRCPSCGATCAPAQRYCYDCSYSFASASLEKRVDNRSAILTDDEKPETYNVMSMATRLHRKKNADDDHPPSMEVSYITMAGVFKEWICFEHHRFDVDDPRRYAWDRAVAWHKRRLPDEKCPNTVADALSRRYPIADTITVKKEGKYKRIVSVDFDGMTAPEQEEVSQMLDEYNPFV